MKLKSCHFQVQELVARHVVRQDVATLCLQHGGEHDAVEHDIVFSDEVYQTRFGVFPPFLPCVGQQLFGVADVADRGVEPYIEHFALGTSTGTGIPQSRSRLTARGCKPMSSQLLHWP